MQRNQAGKAQINNPELYITPSNNFKFTGQEPSGKFVAFHYKGQG
jgi:hypothetical protein